MDTIKRADFENSLLALLKESFDDVTGIYLDGGTALFDTLAGIDAATASRPFTPGGTSIAGHVEHMRWYFEITEGFINGEQYEGFDWKETWQVTAVDKAEWTALVGSLRSGADRMLEMMRTFDDWSQPRIGGMMAVLAHTAYHIGAIRQMLKVVGR